MISAKKFALFALLAGAASARTVLQDDDEDRMLLAIRKPEAAAASISSIEVTFGTGPALRTFDYSVKCVDFAATGESIIDGCDADPAGDGAVTGLTTRSASTITAQVTGLFPLVEYYCYVSVESEKASKCMPVGSVTIPFPVDATVNMAAINAASTVTSWYTPGVIGADISAYDEITASLATYYASLSGNVMAVSMNGFSVPSTQTDYQAGLWITQDIAGYSAATPAATFPGTDPDTQFTQLDPTSAISTTLATSGAKFEISGKRMVAWNAAGDLFLAEDYTTGTWTETVPNTAGAEVIYASIWGNAVAVALPDSIKLIPDAFAEVSIELIFGLPADLDTTSVSLSGPFLAVTTQDNNNAPQIWVQDLRTLGDELSLVEVPVPTADGWTNQNNEPVIVSIFYNQMMVTFVDSGCSDTNCGNMATTSDWSSVAANTWTTYTTGYVTNQQLAMTNLPV